MTSTGVDRELLAVLVALEPLDDRKWDYLNLADRTFHADRMLDEPWSSGERVLIQVAASLWDSGSVDLGYVACALSGLHLQAVLDATALRAGQDLASNVDRAIARISPASLRPQDPPRESTRAAGRRGINPSPHPERGERGLAR